MENKTEIAIDKLQNQLPYYPASESCDPLNSVVPKSLAIEQKNFSLELKQIYEGEGGVAKFVMDRLQYKSIESFCNAFSKEQIDAIATAIYNFENRDFGIILADQTGIGKGRVIAGLIRYSLVYLNMKPTFFTVDSTLYSDIYRDLIDIEFEANIPTYLFGKFVEVDVDSLSDEDIEEIIREDIDNNNVKIEYEYDEDEFGSLEDALEDESVLADIISLYRDFIRDNGIQEPPQKISEKEYAKKLKEIEEKGLRRIIPFSTKPFTISTGEGILYKVPQKEIKKAIEKRKVPSGVDFLLMTYSQLRRVMVNQEKTDKLRMIENFMNDGVVILDESHKGAGSASATGKVLKTLLKNSRHVAYVSATYSKREENMPLYTIATAMKEAMLTEYQLVEAFKNGDTALKEAVSAELVKIGQLIRRERKFEGETFYEEESESSNTGVEQIYKLNQTSLLWNAVIDFQKEYFKTLNSIADQFASANPSTFSKSSIKRPRSIRARTFELFNYFLLAIKVKQSSKKIVEELQNGRKVVVSIANTLESAFSNIKKDYVRNNPYELGDTIPNDFNQVLVYLLSETMKFNFDGVEVSDLGRKTRVKQQVSLFRIPKNSNALRYQFARALFDEMNASFNELADRILSHTFNVPLSPIDEILVRVRNEGFSIKEVTGRSRQLRFSKNDDGNYNFKEGIIERRVDRDKLQLVKDFNENKTDVLIINQSSATGVSMHSLPTLVNKKIAPPVDKLPQKNEQGQYIVPTSLMPKNEVKARTMIIVQMELDVNNEVQKLGRVNRTGQIYPPNYYYIISCIPAEKRLQAIMKKKLSSLMSLTSGGQNQGDDLFTADDFFSKVAVEPFNEAIDETKVIANDVDIDLDITKATTKTDIEKGTKVFYFMNYDVQKYFFNKFSSLLRQTIEELKRLKLYDGEVVFKDYRSKTNDIIPYLICNDNAYTEFGRHVFSEWNTIKKDEQKNTQADLYGEIFDNNAIERATNQINSLFNELKADASIVIQNANETISSFNNDIDELEKELSNFSRGEDVERLMGEIKEKQGTKDSIDSFIAQKTREMDYGDDFQKATKDQQEIAREIEKIQAELNKIVGDYGQAQYIANIRILKRDIDYKLERIEAQNSLILRKEFELAYKTKNYEEVIKLLGQIGDVFEFKTYREKQETKEDDYGNIEVLSYSYEMSDTKKAVLCRISISDLTPSGMNINFGFPQRNESISFGSLFSYDKSQEQLEKGFRPHCEIEPIGKKYNEDNYWNNYLSTLDLARYVQKIFLSGNILKAKAFQTILSAEGTITKYNTYDDKLRIGLETTDENFSKFNESVNYDLLMTLTNDNINRILLPLIVEHFNKKKIYLELFYSRTKTFLCIELNEYTKAILDEKINAIPINVNRLNYQDETEYELAIESEEKKRVQMVVASIKDDMTSLGRSEIFNAIRYTILSESDEEVYVFHEILKESIGSNLKLSNDFLFGEDDNIAHEIFVHELVSRDNRGNLKKRFPQSKLLQDGEYNQETKYYVPTSDDYFSYKSEKVREKFISRNPTIEPEFSIRMTPLAFLSLINYLENVENLQMVCACKKESVDLAQPQYVFNLTSSSMGEIDDLIGERIDNVGSRTIATIENILDELVKILA